MATALAEAKESSKVAEYQRSETLKEIEKSVVLKKEIDDAKKRFESEMSSAAKENDTLKTSLDRAVDRESDIEVQLAAAQSQVQDEVGLVRAELEESRNQTSAESNRASEKMVAEIHIATMYHQVRRDLEHEEKLSEEGAEVSVCSTRNGSRGAGSSQIGWAGDSIPGGA